MTEPKIKAVDEVVDSGIDLADLDTSANSDKGARIELVHPTTKEGLGIYITVLGKHSQVFRDIVRERINKRTKAEALAAKRGKTPEPRTAEEFERDALELLVACSVGWETELKDSNGNVVDIVQTIKFEKQDIPFNVQNAFKVYSKIIWIREQVDEAIGDLENFIQA